MNCPIELQAPIPYTEVSLELSKPERLKVDTISPPKTYTLELNQTFTIAQAKEVMKKYTQAAASSSMAFLCLEKNVGKLNNFLKIDINYYKFPAENFELNPDGSPIPENFEGFINRNFWIIGPIKEVGKNLCSLTKIDDLEGPKVSLTCDEKTQTKIWKALRTDLKNYQFQLEQRNSYFALLSARLNELKTDSTKTKIIALRIYFSNRKVNIPAMGPFALFDSLDEFKNDLVDKPGPGVDAPGYLWTAELIKNHPAR